MTLTPVKRKHYAIPDGSYVGRWSGNRVYVYKPDTRDILGSIDVKEQTDRNKHPLVNVDVTVTSIKIKLLQLTKL